MSSPLDGRIRALAREEATALLGVGTPTAETGAGVDRMTSLDQKVTELSATVKRLDARLDALEKAAGQTDQEGRPTARRTRKTSDE